MSFRGFCQNATDAQLRNIIQKEYDGKKRDKSREADYEAACSVAEARGMTVDRDKGEVS